MILKTFHFWKVFFVLDFYLNDKILIVFKILNDFLLDKLSIIDS